MELIISFLMCIFIGGVITGNILGDMRNKAGQTVFYIWKGIQVFRAMVKATYSDTPLQQAVRGKFRIVTKFAAAVYSLDALAGLWKVVTKSRTIVINKIFTTNYPYATSSDLSESATLVPPMQGFPVTTTDVTVDETGVSVSIDPIGTNAGIDTNVEKYIQLNAVVKCSDPNVEGPPSLFFIPVASGNVVLNLANPLMFDGSFTDEKAANYALYDTHLTYIALVTLTDDGIPVHNSSVFTS